MSFITEQLEKLKEIKSEQDIALDNAVEKLDSFITSLLRKSPELEMEHIFEALNRASERINNRKG